MGMKHWGIDFGTTTTYLSSTERVPDRLVHIGRFGEPFIPSVAGFDGSSLLYCEDTNRLEETYKIRSIKYLITRGLNAGIQIGIAESKDIEKGRYRLLPGRGSSQEQWLSVRSSEGPKEVEAGEIIKGILKTLVARADLDGESKAPTRMGCPAMWDASQRRRLLDLAQEIGLEVSDGTLLDEPIAACINWLEQNRTREINGNVVIFDMGGGTLDVSIINVQAKPGVEPKIFVLSSGGLSEAGNEFDIAIADTIVKKLAAADSNRYEELLESYGWVQELGRVLKENLQEQQLVQGTLLIPGSPSEALALSRREIIDSVSDQMDRGMQLVFREIRAGLATVPDLQLGGAKPGLSYIKRIMSLTDSQLLNRVDYFVLAGGMVRMPLLREMLVERGVRQDIIEFADRTNPAEAIAKGLGSESVYQRMNLHLPSFSFYLEWFNPETGHIEKIDIYKAHTRLVSRIEAIQGNLEFRFRFNERDLPWHGEGLIKGVSVDGQPITFSVEGRESDGLPFEFGGVRDSIFKMDRAGRIFLRDMSGNQHGWRVDGWPLVRGEKFSKIELFKEVTSDQSSGAWYTYPENMRR
jgi:molecular chaperone DnaK (HSP70)